jgi:hypothetical protein
MAPDKPTPRDLFGASSIRIRAAKPAPVDIRKDATKKQHPLVDGSNPKSLVAASRRVDRTNKAESETSKAREWQNEGWSFYNQVGELHYAANVHANTVGRVNYPLARYDERGEIVLLESLEDGQLTAADRLAIQAMRELSGNSINGLGELARAHALHLFVAGDSRLIGTPPTDHDGEIGSDDPLTVQMLAPEGGNANEQLVNLTWKAYSSSDVREIAGKLKIAGKEYDPADVLEIVIWRKHPQFSNTPDSPVLGVLPVLRELLGLTMHISATIDSRLAGAGVLILPQSAVALGASAPEEASDVDPLVEAIIEAAVTPIKDRDSAAAVVPVIIKVPDESVAGVQHITFSTPFDAAPKELRDEAIRRIALGLDLPPESMLGLGESSHWNAWAIQEDNIRLHVLPAANIIAEAWVRDYLRPVLEELGVDHDLAETYFLQPEADELIARPNRTDEAVRLFELGAISREALLREAGFDVSDAPPEQAELDPWITAALDLVKGAPSLMQDPGLLVVVAQLKAVLTGEPYEHPEGAPTPENSPGGPVGEPAQDTESEPNDADQPGPPEQGTPDNSPPQ